MSIHFDTKVILGIDYSYEETGYAIVKDGELCEVGRLNFGLIEKRFLCKLDHQDRRKLLHMQILRLHKEYGITCVILERVRQFSRGFISLPAIAAFSELIVVVIDSFHKNIGMPQTVLVLSVDVRVWKKRIHAHANAKKNETIEWARQRLTLPVAEKRKWRNLTDNEADAIALAFFALHQDASELVKVEK